MQFSVFCNHKIFDCYFDGMLRAKMPSVTAKAQSERAIKFTKVSCNNFADLVPVGKRIAQDSYTTYAYNRVFKHFPWAQFYFAFSCLVISIRQMNVFGLRWKKRKGGTVQFWFSFWHKITFALKHAHLISQMEGNLCSFRSPVFITWPQEWCVNIINLWEWNVYVKVIHF